MKKCSKILNVLFVFILSIGFFCKVHGCENCSNEFIQTELSKFELPFKIKNVSDLDGRGDSFINDIFLIKSQDGNEYILKLSNSAWGFKKLINEVNVIKFLSLNSSILVPKIVYFSADESKKIGDHHFILMKRIKGKPLSVVWQQLSDAEKVSYSSQLADVVAKLRKFKFMAIGSFTSTEYKFDVDTFFSTEIIEFPDHNIVATQSFNEYVIQSLSYYTKIILEKYKDDLSILDLTRKLDAFIKNIQSNNKLVFDEKYVLSHLDLSKKNIMVLDGKLTGILDWEWASSHTPNMESLASFDFLETEKMKSDFFSKAQLNNLDDKNINAIQLDFYDLIHHMYCLACFDEWGNGKKLSHTARFLKSKLIQRRLKVQGNDKDYIQRNKAIFINELEKYLEFMSSKYS